MTTTGMKIHQSVTVDVGIEKAFSVFTDRIGDWWTREHHLGKAELATVVIEPPFGRPFLRGRDRFVRMRLGSSDHLWASDPSCAWVAANGRLGLRSGKPKSRSGSPRSLRGRPVSIWSTGTSSDSVIGQSRWRRPWIPTGAGRGSSPSTWLRCYPTRRRSGSARAPGRCRGRCASSSRL
jgi:hypothetical protein